MGYVIAGGAAVIKLELAHLVALRSLQLVATLISKRIRQISQKQLRHHLVGLKVSLMEKC
jgi:hypothetical protein